MFAGSIALLGPAVDSFVFVESALGLVLIWRLAAEWRGMDDEAVERMDERARKPVGVSVSGRRRRASFNRKTTAGCRR